MVAFQALRALLEEINKPFPGKVDISKITACLQKPDEPVEDDLTRLIAVFDQNSGTDRPADLTGTPGGVGKPTSATVS